MEKDSSCSPKNLKMIFNYENVFYSFIYDTSGECVHQSRDYALNYVYSGEMMLETPHGDIHVHKGESVFIPRDHRVKIHKKPYNDENYCGIFLKFTRPFLREMISVLRQENFSNTKKMAEGVIKLPPTVELQSLFASMTPYINPDVKPKGDFMNLKLREGLMALLAVDNRFAATLFDFNQPWKIDIIGFMEENYMYDLSMEDIAHYTGRSLSTFKRDFKKLSELTPGKWIVRKRLEVAYDMICHHGRRISDIYSEIGFRNPSHFSTAFKRHYGVSPASLYKTANTAGEV